MLHSRFHQGNLLYYATHRKRLIDAIGEDVFRFLDDFERSRLTAADALLGATITLVEAGAGGETTVAYTDAAGGALLITTDNADNDGVNIQWSPEAFKLAAGNVLYFGIRLQISETTQADFFAGLAITDTDILGGVTDRIGFEKLDGATAVKAMLEKDSTETLTASLLTQDADAYHVLEFYLDENGGVEFFVDGASAAQPAVTNLPDNEELRVSLQFLTGAAAVETMQVDWIRCIQVGGRA